MEAKRLVELASFLQEALERRLDELSQKTTELRVALGKLEQLPKDIQQILQSLKTLATSTNPDEVASALAYLLDKLVSLDTLIRKRSQRLGEVVKLRSDAGYAVALTTVRIRDFVMICGLEYDIGGGHHCVPATKSEDEIVESLKEKLHIDEECEPELRQYVRRIKQLLPQPHTAQVATKLA